MSAADRPVRTQAAPRHAVYFAPAPSHPLWALGCSWLGRDRDGGATAGVPAHPLLATPWRYGFHATLKAPMALADGVGEAQWLAAVRTLAARQRPFALPPLQVARLADFIALRPRLAIDAGHPLRRLADDCVRTLDPLRAPLPAAAPARRPQPALNARQRDQLERFGYAHVFDDWRFHMTLSASLAGIEAERIDALQACAARHFAPALDLALDCDALCVFVEPAPGQPFELRHRFTFEAP